MKKILFILVLLIPFCISAKQYTIEDLTVSFDKEWTVFTRDNIENNYELTKRGLTTDYMEKLFNENDIYIDAVDYNHEKASDNIEILFGIKPTELERNLHKYNEKELKELEEEMIKGLDVSDHGIYNTGKYKYVYMVYKDNGINVCDYYTVINGNGYTIKLQKVNKFTQEDLNDFKKQINTIYYKVDPAYEKDINRFNWKSIIIYAAIGAIVGGITSVIKRKKTNS